MKRNRKSILFAAAAAVLVMAIAVIYFVKRQSGETAEYLQICLLDFNEPEQYGELRTDSYQADGTEFGYDPTGGLDGTGCVTIHSSAENDARFTYRYESALEETYYRMSVWVRTENVGTSASGTDNTAVGANLSVLNTYSHSVSYTGSSDWTYIEYYGKTGEGQTDFIVCLRLGFYGGMNTGTVYFKRRFGQGPGRV